MHRYCHREPRTLFFRILTLYHEMPTFNDPMEKGSRKHCGKKKIPHNVSYSIKEIIHR